VCVSIARASLRGDERQPRFGKLQVCGVRRCHARVPAV
jgi:hypothetical protein